MCATPPQPTLPPPSRPHPLQDLVEGLRSCVWTPLPEGWVEHFDPRTNQPYYTNTATGIKQWERPEGACPLIHVSESSHMQPMRMRPRTSAEALSPVPEAAVA